MKICVFADIHGSIDGMKSVVKIIELERPNKVVICGDLFGPRDTQKIVDCVSQIDAVTYLVRGNNDRAAEVALLPCGMDDYAIMYHFGRSLFFTHGHVYNKYRVPPVLHENDVLIYGHTHCALLQRFNGLYIANVGSVSRPRDGEPSYLTLEDNGIILKRLNGEPISELPW